jgi:FlaA1/EpsC-like NDP-sugar epimerase
MALPLLHRTDRVHGIEARIDDLGEQATKLLGREEAALAKLEDLRSASREPKGRLRGARISRGLRRGERLVEQLRSNREELVERELRSIMLALEKQSRRTRDRLDRELERLAPVQGDWERLRATFDTLETALASPAIEQLAGQWRGTLAIPEFPVREGEGYVRPFPARVLLF